MWRRVNNLVNSLLTYQTLSPDVRLRHHVNEWLHERPGLSCDQWFETFWKANNILQTTAEFVYYTVASYSGLHFAYVVPSDRLEENLYWTHICWFDWELTLFDDVKAQFNIDISDRFHYSSISTVSDLMQFLDYHIRQSNFSY